MQNIQTLQHINLQALNWIDYSILGVLSFSILIGLMRGFVREALSLITWIIALTVGVLYYERVSHWFSRISDVELRLILAFILIVIAILIIGGIIIHIIELLINFIHFGFTDRFLGTLFGFARGVLIIGVVIMLVSSTVLAQDPAWKHSQFIPVFNPFSVWLKEKLPSGIMDKVFNYKKGDHHHHNKGS